MFGSISNILNIDSGWHNAQNFQARCYAPYIFDKETLYVKEMTPYGASGGAGAARSVRRRLANDLQIRVDAFQGTNMPSRENRSRFPVSWAGSMVVPLTTAITDPYCIYCGNDRDQLQRSVYSQNSSNDNSAIRIWGIRSGLCDGSRESFESVESTLVETPGVIAGDGINPGMLATRNFFVNSVDSNSEGYNNNTTSTQFNYRGHSLSVEFTEPDGVTRPTLIVQAGSAGNNAYSLSEMPKNLFGVTNISTAVQNFNNKLNNVNMNNWKELLQVLGGGGTQRQGTPGNVYGSLVTENFPNYIVSNAAGILSLDRENHNELNSSPGSIQNGDLVRNEAKILKEQGGGSARLVCDASGNARSFSWTGRDPRTNANNLANIEIIPGRIWIEIKTVGANGIGGAQGGDADLKNKEHIAVVKAIADAEFNVRLGKGGKAADKCDAGEEYRENNGVGVYCNGNPGEETTITYGGSPDNVKFGAFSRHGVVEGTLGGSRMRFIRMLDKDSILAARRGQIESGSLPAGSGNISSVGNRIYINLHFGSSTECIFDSAGKNCDPNATVAREEFPGKDGKDASVRIIW